VAIQGLSFPIHVEKFGGFNGPKKKHKHDNLIKL